MKLRRAVMTGSILAGILVLGLVALGVASPARGMTDAVLVPFPGTDLIEKARAGDGLRLIDSDWNGYDKQVGGACEPLDLSLQQVQWLQRYAYLRFYMRPSRASAVGRIFTALGVRNVATFMGRTVQTLLGTGGISSAARVLRGNA